MNIIKKTHIFPIIINTNHYRDRFGNHNSFIEMNPSIHISDDGSYTILVRTVNYVKYPNNQFTVYGNTSTSIYSILRGKIENDRFHLDNYIINTLDVQYNIPTQPSLWNGVEDIRFIDDTTIVACIPECNNGSPCIFAAKLQGNILSSFEKCSPNILEKNWMPYFYETPKVVYSVSPFVIKSVIEDDREERPLNKDQLDELKGWHGSSNAVDYKDNSKLFLIHKNEDRVYSRWLLFNPVTKEVSYSNKFVFIKDSYIEFTCSLTSYKNSLYVGLGVNDNRAYIVELSLENLFQTKKLS